jgi:hypothetical protein
MDVPDTEPSGFVKEPSDGPRENARDEANRT